MINVRCISMVSYEGNPLITGQTASPVPDNDKNSWKLPDFSDVDPGLLRPISDDGG